MAWWVVIRFVLCSDSSLVLTCLSCCPGPEYEWRGPYPDGDGAIPLAKLPRETRL